MQLRIGNCFCTCIIVPKLKVGKYPSLCRTIYQQEGNDKKASHNDRQLEYWEKKSSVFSGQLNI